MKTGLKYTRYNQVQQESLLGRAHSDEVEHLRFSVRLGRAPGEAVRVCLEQAAPPCDAGESA